MWTTTPERDTLANELAAHIPPPEPLESDPGDGDDPTIFEALSASPELCKHVDKSTDFPDKVKQGYRKDALFSKVLKDKEKYSLFQYREGFLYTNNRGKQEVRRIPGVVMKDYSLTATVIEQAYTILGHYGAQKMTDYIHWWYWWPRLGHEVNKYCMTCSICQVNKTSMQRPVGLLHTLLISNRPWGLIGMDFIGPFLKSKGFDYLWVVICRLTSMVHLIPVNTMTKASELVSLYVKEVVHLHRLAGSIASDRDSKFMSMFWHETHWILGTKLLMSTFFILKWIEHPNELTGP